MVRLRLLPSVLLFWLILSPLTLAADMTTIRLENEIILDVPSKDADAVWEWLKTEFPETCSIESVELHCAQSVEIFLDTYFDNSDAQLAKEKTSLRHRQRFFDDGTTKEWIQFKVTLDQEMTTREEMKFDVRQNEQVEEEFDDHPLLRLIRKRDRINFQKTLIDHSVDPLTLRPALDLHQIRQRIYISDTEPMITLSLDITTSQRLWKKVKAYSIDIELNELRYTKNVEERELMRQLQTAVLSDVLTAFPDLVQNQTPKYTEMFHKIFDALPWGRRLWRWGLL